MPRKRTIDDETLLDAALRIVHEAGPDALTFASLAARVGLAPATIVQRFKTKPGLLQATLLRAWDLLDEQTAQATSTAADDSHGVVELLVSLTGQYDAHDFADQLLVLREDLRDPVLRARGEAWLATLNDAVEQRLTQLPDGGAGLGPLIVAHWQGMLTVWSFTRPGPVTVVVRTALEDLVARLVSHPGARREASRRSPRRRRAR